MLVDSPKTCIPKTEGNEKKSGTQLLTVIKKFLLWVSIRRDKFHHGKLIPMHATPSNKSQGVDSELTEPSFLRVSMSVQAGEHCLWSWVWKGSLSSGL